MNIHLAKKDEINSVKLQTLIILYVTLAHLPRPQHGSYCPYLRGSAIIPQIGSVPPPFCLIFRQVLVDERRVDLYVIYIRGQILNFAKCKYVTLN